MVAKPRILVVDDEPVVRESLHAWFSTDEYPIEMAADGPETKRNSIIVGTVIAHSQRS